MRIHNRGIAFILAGLTGLLTVGPVQAFDFEIFGLEATVTNKVTLGGLWRVEDRDKNLIGKSNLMPGICLERESDGSISGDGCNSTSDPSLNDRFVALPGTYSPNGDDGNLNYDKWDLASATAKLTSDLNFSINRFDFFIRGLYFFDEENVDAFNRHTDTTFQPEKTRRPNEVNRLSGTDFDILDAYVSTIVPFFGERELTVKVGDQVVSWGESTFLVLNSINSINPPNATRLRTPGFDVKELFVPTGMVVLSSELFPNFGVEAFYNYEFDPAVPDPAGTFFSSAETIVPGGEYAMLSFSKAPEDPDQSYDPSNNASIPGFISGTPQDATGLFSSSSRTIRRVQDRLPKEDGQYGLSMTYFFEDLGGGTEFALYYMNYHSRLPIASFIAADASCAINSTTLMEAAADCGGVDIAGVQPEPRFGAVNLAAEPLPVETVTFLAEYPEDVQLYGFSFNTLLGDWAWSGEVAYRPNLPLQLHSTDLTFAALQPAFPAEDAPVCAGSLLTAIVTGVVANCTPLELATTGALTVIPGRRSAVPDTVMTKYRNREVGPNDYIRGYERMKSWNVGTTFLNTLGGGHWASSFFKADQVVVLFEAGFNYIEDFPSLHELQFNGPGTDTHISAGADGTAGTYQELGQGCRDGNGPDARACRQNPTAEDSQNFPDKFSWGTRNIFLLRYQNALYGANLEPLFGVFADWDGIQPGPGNNFTEGNRTYILGLRADYLNKWTGELRYSILDGNEINNPLADRDNVFLFAGYEF